MLRFSVFLLAVFLLLPGTALAGGTAALDGNRLIVTGTPGVDMVNVAKNPYTDELVVAGIGLDQSLWPQAAGAGCVRESRNHDYVKIFCPAAGVTAIVVATGDGDDRVTTEAELPTSVDAGAGDDWVEHYGAAATIRLGDGDDQLGGGKKAQTRLTVSGGAGDDDLGCGDDNRATPVKGARILDGGAGKDRICGGRADDRLDGGAGNDKVFAGEGDDKLDGDAGDDMLRGDDDNDTIVGGRGEDEIEGGSGKDTIRVKDREVDEVDGGSRRDTVVADKSDDLSRCEIIRR